MKVLGLTGGIGSGKSTVAGMLAELGAYIIDADRLARDAVVKGSPGLTEIHQYFGDQAIGPDGELDRAWLGTLVFDDQSARKALEAIVHPKVAILYQAALQRAQNLTKTWVVYDVPLLFENGLERQFEKILVVWASLPQRKKRLVARSQLAEKDIKARIASQISLEQKLAKADFSIDNDQSLEITRQQVRALYPKLVSCFAAGDAHE